MLVTSYGKYSNNVVNNKVKTKILHIHKATGVNHSHQKNGFNAILIALENSSRNSKYLRLIHPS